MKASVQGLLRCEDRSLSLKHPRQRSGTDEQFLGPTEQSGRGFWFFPALLLESLSFWAQRERQVAPSSRGGWMGWAKQRFNKRKSILVHLEKVTGGIIVFKS